MRFQKIPNVFIFLMTFTLTTVQAKIKVATSLPDFASIVATIGGHEVEVFSIAKSNSNPHFIEVLPSYMIKVSRVALYFKVGMELDQWANAILEGSRNANVVVVDCSQGIEVLDKPVGKVDASLGDVHHQGNPHYWLDPNNGGIISDQICNALIKVDPQHAEFYSKNNQAFKNESQKRIQVWKTKMASFKDVAILTYHSSWAYFAHAFNFKIVGYVEPFPGIPPTAKHLQSLVEKIKSGNVKLLIQEPYYSESDSKFLSRQTGIPIFRFTPSCEGIGANDYLNHFDSMVQSLVASGIKK